MSGFVSLGIVVVVLGLASGCWLRTDAPVLSEVNGITTGQILDQFQVESEPSLGTQTSLTVAKPLAPIVHPDPLDLPPLSVRIATTAPGAALINAVATAFRDDGFRGTTVERRLPATGAVQSLCDGEADIAQIDRPLTQREIEVCADRGIELATISVALDRIVLVAHPDNFWVGSITGDQIESVLTAMSWSDVNERWPRRPITKYLPAPNSPEMDAITRAAWFAGSPDINTSNLADAVYLEQAVDRLSAVAADPTSIAFVAMGDLRLSAVDFVVRPVDTDDPLGAAVYPIERTVRLVVSQSELEQRAELASFVAYYLNRIEALAPTFNLAPPASLADTRRDIVQRLVGESAGGPDRGLLTIDELP